MTIILGIIALAVVYAVFSRKTTLRNVRRNWKR